MNTIVNAPALAGTEARRYLSGAVGVRFSEHRHADFVHARHRGLRLDVGRLAAVVAHRRLRCARAITERVGAARRCVREPRCGVDVDARRALRSAAVRLQAADGLRECDLEVSGFTPPRDKPWGSINARCR